MKKNKISSYIFIVALLSLLAVLVLIIQDSYINLMGQSAKIDATPGEAINPSLNTSVIDEIFQREELTFSFVTSPATNSSTVISP